MGTKRCRVVVSSDSEDDDVEMVDVRKKEEDMELSPGYKLVRNGFLSQFNSNQMICEIWSIYVLILNNG